MKSNPEDNAPSRDETRVVTNPRPHTPPTPEIPDHELLRQVGSGSYGDVWLARNIMGTHRAVKIVYRNRFESARPYEREFAGIQKFEPVSRSHPSQVDILHIGRNDELGYFYYVMELGDAVAGSASKTGGARVPASPNQSSEGAAADNPSQRGNEAFDADVYEPRTLKSDLFHRGRLPSAECLDVALSLTTALGHLHENGLIHRDVKPANVIFVNGLPKLADIGLVTEAGEGKTFVGTEGYFPSEGPGAPSADIYSLGKVLYEMNTGRDRMDFPELPTNLAEFNDGSDVVELNEIILKACAGNPEKRYASAAEMHEDLLLLKAGNSVRHARALERRLASVKRIGVTSGILALILFGIVSLAQRETQRSHQKALEIRQVQLESSERELQSARALSEARNRELQSAKELSVAKDRVAQSMTQLAMQRVEGLFEDGKPHDALAELAFILRNDPDNDVAAQRLLSALTYRNFAVPVAVLRDEALALFNGTSFSPDGRWILTRSTNRAHLWSVETGTLQTLEIKHQDRINGAAFNPRGDLLLTASADKTARLWDLNKMEPRAPALVHGVAVLDARFSRNGSLVVTWAENHVAQVWNTVTGEPVGKPMRHADSVKVAGVSSDGRRRITATWKGGAWIWDETGRVVVALPEPRGTTRIEINAEGSRILTSSQDGTARVWNASTGQPLGLPFIAEQRVFATQMSPVGDRAVSRTASALHVWNPWTGERLYPELDFSNSSGFVWGFDASGSKLLVDAGTLGTALWDAQSGDRLMDSVKHYRANLPSAAVAPAASRLLVLTGADEARIVDATSGAARPLTLQHGGEVNHAAFSPDGTRILTASDDKTAALWDARTGGMIQRLPHPGRVYHALIAPDGKLGITVCADRTMRLWDLKAGQMLFASQLMQSGRGGSTFHVGFSRDGMRLFVANRLDSAIYMWDLTDPENPIETTLETEMLGHAAMSPRADRIVCAPYRGAARLWDTAAGEIVGRPLENDSRIIFTAFSPGGGFVVTGATDQTARLWDAENGAPRSGNLMHDQSVICAAFSPDEKRLVTGAAGGLAQVWSVETGDPVGTPFEHRTPVHSAQFSLDGLRILTDSGDHKIRLWDASSGVQLSEPFGHNKEIRRAEFSPDGRRVLTASTDGTAKVWDLMLPPAKSPTWLPDLAEAVAGRRINEKRAIEPVPAEAFFRIGEQRRKGRGDDFYGRWASWFFADRTQRRISPFSPTSVPQFVQELIDQNTEVSVREALRLNPTNGLAVARLGAILLNGDSLTGEGRKEAVKFYAEKAIKIAPEDPEAMEFAELVNAISGAGDTASAGGDAEPAEEVIKSIEFKKTPLIDAIGMLARQAGLEVEVDSKVEAKVGGRLRPVNLLFQGVTASDALNSLLANHDLLMLKASAAGKRRIVPKPLWEEVRPFQSIRHREFFQMQEAANIVPTIAIVDMDLPDAIRFLAKYGKINLLMAPEITAPRIGPMGKPLRFKFTREFENASPLQALEVLLREHFLTLIPDPRTGVARVVSGRVGAGGIAVTPSIAEGFPRSTNGESIPTIVFEGTPIEDVITMLARQAGVNFVFSPEAGGQLLSQRQVLTCWQTDVTARHLLEAIIDNYGLVLEPNPKTYIGRLHVKKD